MALLATAAASLATSASYTPTASPPHPPSEIPRPPSEGRWGQTSDEQFATWVMRLHRNFTTCDLATAFSSGLDPDLILVLFRLATLRLGFCHRPREEGEQPGVLQVVPSQTYQLHGPGAGTQGGHAGTTHTMDLM